MGILVIHPDFTSSMGGAKKTAYNIAAAAAEVSDTMLYTEENSLREAEKKHDLNLEGLNHSKLKPPLTTKVYQILGRGKTYSRKAIAKKVMRLIEKESPDLVILTASIPNVSSNLDMPVIQYIHSPGANRKFDANLNLFNSDRTRDKCDIDGEIMSPPASEWGVESEGEDILVLGRVSSDKKTAEAVKIGLEADKDVHVVGSVDESYFKRNKDLFTQANIHEYLELSDLREVVAECGYIINSKKEEDYGLNVAEAANCGLRPVIPEGSGPTFIVKNALEYKDIEEAKMMIKEDDGQKPLVENLNLEPIFREKFRSKISCYLD